MLTLTGLAVRWVPRTRDPSTPMPWCCSCQPALRPDCSLRVFAWSSEPVSDGAQAEAVDGLGTRGGPFLAVILGKYGYTAARGFNAPLPIAQIRKLVADLEAACV